VRGPRFFKRRSGNDSSSSSGGGSCKVVQPVSRKCVVPACWHNVETVSGEAGNKGVLK
jgi:hypothetical protein